MSTTFILTAALVCFGATVSAMAGFGFNIVIDRRVVLGVLSMAAVIGVVNGLATPWQPRTWELDTMVVLVLLGLALVNWPVIGLIRGWYPPRWIPADNLFGKEEWFRRWVFRPIGYIIIVLEIALLGGALLKATFVSR